MPGQGLAKAATSDTNAMLGCHMPPRVRPQLDKGIDKGIDISSSGSCDTSSDKREGCVLFRFSPNGLSATFVRLVVRTQELEPKRLRVFFEIVPKLIYPLKHVSDFEIASRFAWPIAYRVLPKAQGPWPTMAVPHRLAPCDCVSLITCCLPPIA